MLAHISAVSAQQGARGSGAPAPPNLLTVLRDVRTTLGQAAGLAPDPRAFVALPRRLRAPPFRLLQSEVLQIFNHVPRDRDGLALLLEDAEQRFAEVEMDEMLRIIEDVLVKGEGLDEVGPLEEGDGGGKDGSEEAEAEGVVTGEES